MDVVIQHLWKTYPNGTTALRDVSLTIPPGMFGLLGPNGAGKSTLMRILATLQEAESGTARLGEIDVLRDLDAVRRTLGYLPQEFGLYPRVTAEDMLDHFGLLKGLVDGRERRETVHALLQQTNLYHARRQKLGSFSGGMRQRFGIAVALIGRPRLIIVDEPTAGLDPAERARFLNLLSELGESAVVILSTHIVEDVSELCTRMAIIAGGRILLEGEPAAAVGAMRGRVWRRQVDRADLPGYEQALPVISTTLVGGRTVIHVYADAPPDPTFEPVEPDLKDVYFTAIRGIPITPPGTGAPAPPAPATAFVTRVLGGEPDAPPQAQPFGAPGHRADTASSGWSPHPPASPHEPRTPGAPADPPSSGPPTIAPSEDVRSIAGEPRPSAADAFAGETRTDAAQQPPAPPPHPPATPEQARGGAGAAHMPSFGEAPAQRRRAEGDGPDGGEAP
ncbi:MAG TPA: ATP-binding cassette domain-containing protein [Longimicrobium sp.]|jgi:ABC-type multidrug transport system ATPase subunit